MKNPPYAASTCSQHPSSAQTSAMGSSGSIAPVFVVPAEATTMKGMLPAARSSAIVLRSASTSICSSGVTGTARTFPAGNPAREAAFGTEAWAWSEV